MHDGYNHSVGATSQFHGVQAACICSGFASYTHVRIKVRQGKIPIWGIGWTSEVNAPCTPHALVHNDNIVGNPGSLSYQKIKSGVTALDPTTCLSICCTLAPGAYLRTNNDDIRTGLIAQEVAAALTLYSMPTLPITGRKMASVDPGTCEEPGSEPEELLTLAYARLVPPLLGSVKALTERIQQL